MNWRIKGAIQKVLGGVPGGERLHLFLQRRAGGLKNFASECDLRVDDWELMAGHLTKAGLPIAGTRFLEVGTGWYPALPFMLYLAGADRIDTLDLNRHLEPELTRACATHLGGRLARIADASGHDAAAIEARHRGLVAALARGAALDDATEGVVRYRAPADAADSKLPDGSLDVYFSNSVLEHIPGPVIERCFAEARRVLRPGGILYNSVNCGDHYAYVDKSINQLNYLRYSDAAWRRWNNEFLYQNRLRAIDFTDLARAAGFTIELDTSRPHPTRLAQLAEIEVHPDFGKYSRDQLAITSIDFIGRNPG